MCRFKSCSLVHTWLQPSNGHGHNRADFARAGERREDLKLEASVLSPESNLCRLALEALYAAVRRLVVGCSSSVSISENEKEREEVSEEERVRELDASFRSSD